MTQLLVTLPEAAQALGLGLTKTRELVESGRLPVVRFDRSVRVPVAALEKLAQSHKPA